MIIVKTEQGWSRIKCRIQLEEQDDLDDDCDDGDECDDSTFLQYWLVDNQHVSNKIPAICCFTH
jgi:hypothetical protein